ncbi:MAG: DNA-binding response regulator [Pseudopedobacter saltans]|uniref:DNA-binding response regulator n=1 Tax=Pseudopedobacter saltans TaxID=151895 RepID=A0A2W5EWY3_9SPHI|nr:MAG: DNA-binding response regulator [Pseudopedobacter saltans]
MKCVIIDDEPLALELMQAYVKQNKELELVGKFTDALLGKDFLHNNSVDLLFLDIQMPDITGLQLFESLSEKPLAIFTTAYSNFAVQGFDLDAVDYLVKPFSMDRFNRAVAKAKELFDIRNNPSSESEFMYVKYDYQWNKIFFKDVNYIEALDDYIRIFNNENRSVLVHLSMKAVMEKLPEDKFIRVHRSFIVAVDRIQRWNKNALTVLDREVPISVTYQKQVQDILEKRLK